MDSSDQVYFSDLKSEISVNGSFVNYLVMKNRQIVYGNPLKGEGIEIKDITISQFANQLARSIEEKIKKYGDDIKIKINVYKNLLQSTYAFEIYANRIYSEPKQPPSDMLMPACFTKIERLFYNVEQLVDKKSAILVKD